MVVEVESPGNHRLRRAAQLAEPQKDADVGKGHDAILAVDLSAHFALERLTLLGPGANRLGHIGLRVESQEVHHGVHLPGPGHIARQEPGEQAVLLQHAEGVLEGGLHRHAERAQRGQRPGAEGVDAGRAQ